MLQNKRGRQAHFKAAQGTTTTALKCGPTLFVFGILILTNLMATVGSAAIQEQFRWDKCTCSASNASF